MLKCTARPNQHDRDCKYCGDHIPEGTTFAEHNLTCANNKFRTECTVCHKSELKVDINEKGQCKRCVDIIECLKSRQNTPLIRETPARKYGIVKKTPCVA